MKFNKNRKVSQVWLVALFSLSMVMVMIWNTHTAIEEIGKSLQGLASVSTIAEDSE